jgi:hypothetical protein
MVRYRPTISVSLPSGWFAKESLTLLAPDGQANVIASSEPLDPSIDTKKYAEVQGDLLENEFPEFESFSFEETDVFGRGTGYIRRFQWQPPDGVPVMQMQLYYAESGTGYTATATTPSSEFPRYEPDLRDALESLLIESVQPAAAPVQ